MVKPDMSSPLALQSSDGPSRRTTTRLLGIAALMLVAVTLWSCWPTILGLYRGGGNSDYSAGQLVPIVALILIYRDRKTLRQCTLKPAWFGGMILIVLASIARFYGMLSVAHPSIEQYSLVLTVAGLVLLVAGWRVLRRLFWILAFLSLTVPLPGRVHNLIATPLQSMATTGSAFVLEAFIQVDRQGNTLILNGDTPVGVAEACSGLRMLMAFIIVAAFVAYMIKRPRWQKAALLASSIPVAIVSNVIRIVVTAILMIHVDAKVADKFFHDFAGLVMMPAAVLLIFAELWLMDRLTVSQPDPQHVHKRTRTRHDEGNPDKKNGHSQHKINPSGPKQNTGNRG